MPTTPCDKSPNAKRVKESTNFSFGFPVNPVGISCPETDTCPLWPGVIVGPRAPRVEPVNISHIMCVSGKITDFCDSDSTVVKYVYDIATKEGMVEAAKQMYEYTKMFFGNKSLCLYLHDEEGLSRSGKFATFYLMSLTGHSLETCVY
jgi:hypothetical protein